MFQTKVVDKIKTHILSSITFFCFENHAVYEIMCEKYCRVGQAADDNMVHVHFIESTNKHLEYVILIAVPLQQWLHERVAMLICTLSVCLSVLLDSSQLKFVLQNRVCMAQASHPRDFSSVMGVHVRSMVNRVALGQVSVCILHF